MAVGAATCALLISGCGAERKHRTLTLTGDTVTVVADQYYFDPDTIVTKRGPLEIDFKNSGNLIHNLVLERAGVRVGKAPSLEPGSQTVLKVDLAPGKYTLLCTVGDHEELGMKGEVVVD